MTSWALRPWNGSTWYEIIDFQKIVTSLIDWGFFPVVNWKKQFETTGGGLRGGARNNAVCVDADTIMGCFELRDGHEPIMRNMRSSTKDPSKVLYILLQISEILSIVSTWNVEKTYPTSLECNVMPQWPVCRTNQWLIFTGFEISMRWWRPWRTPIATVHSKGATAIARFYDDSFLVRWEVIQNSGIP